MLDSTLKLIAKLYQCRAKISTACPLVGSQASKSKDNLKMYADPSAEDMWRQLDAYFKHDRAAASPNGFKEFIIASENAGNLGYCAEQLADLLFDEKVKQIIETDHAALMKKLEEGSPRDGTEMTDLFEIESLVHQ